jgi:hypothetical protein
LHDIRTTVGQVLLYFQSLQSIKQQVEWLRIELHCYRLKIQDRSGNGNVDAVS